jgi:hypothetical protein
MRHASAWDIGVSASAMALCPRTGSKKAALAIVGDAQSVNLAIRSDYNYNLRHQWHNLWSIRAPTRRRKTSKLLISP